MIASGEVASVLSVLQAQPARRDELLAELHRSRGNAFVQQVLAEGGGADNHERRHQEAGVLWQRQGAGSGSGSEIRNSADTSKKDRRPVAERRADESNNATYYAMDVQLKLLAYELHAAGRRLSFEVAVANVAKNQDKAQIDATEGRLGAVMGPALDLAMVTAKQLSDLNTEKNDPRLAQGGQSLLAALNEVAPALAEADAWATAHKRDTWGWPVVRVSNGILKLVFPNLVPAAKRLTSIEESPGYMQDTAISAHLDAAIAAAESAKSGNPVVHKERLIMHVKELGELLKNHPRVEGQLAPRIKKLVSIVDQVLVESPWIKMSFDEAFEPLRDVK